MSDGHWRSRTGISAAYPDQLAQAWGLAVMLACARVRAKEVESQGVPMQPFGQLYLPGSSQALVNTPLNASWDGATLKVHKSVAKPAEALFALCPAAPAQKTAEQTKTRAQEHGRAVVRRAQHRAVRRFYQSVHEALSLRVGFVR